jgi:hypothetical protein
MTQDRRVTSRGGLAYPQFRSDYRLLVIGLDRDKAHRGPAMDNREPFHSGHVQRSSVRLGRSGRITVYQSTDIEHVLEDTFFADTLTS